jgi:hypothetical protein
LAITFVRVLTNFMRRLGQKEIGVQSGLTMPGLSAKC